MTVHTPRIAGPRGQCGATLIELIAIAVLISTLVVTAVSKIWELRVVAEKTGLETLIGTLRSTLGMQLVAHVAKHGAKGLEQYHHSNPLDYLKEPPTNYLGEFEAGPSEPVEGAWYFDTSEAALVYHVRFAEYLHNDNHRQPELLRFQVQMRYRDANNNGRFDAAVDSPRALGLVALDNYRWLSPDSTPASGISEGVGHGKVTE
jgi:hypothetical protein